MIHQAYVRVHLLEQTLAAPLAASLLWGAACKCSLQVPGDACKALKRNLCIIASVGASPRTTFSIVCTHISVLFLLAIITRGLTHAVR